ncbi:MAG: hypothetical protein PHQ98_01390 [Candidatus ainarchaeum sp.]|nr:hypothetical protein [Candidatus ainarchaeum sp.]
MNKKPKIELRTKVSSQVCGPIGFLPSERSLIDRNSSLNALKIIKTSPDRKNEVITHYRSLARRYPNCLVTVNIFRKKIPIKEFIQRLEKL